jgi:2-amino-4-hydroxy-6-hydroxymethyldihydropteridine diphosphokinase
VQVTDALQELADIPATSVIKHSQLYRSDPVGPPGQPDYINAVAELETELEPLQLLDQLQAIEAAHQRKRLVRWGPRTLDLDILLIDSETIDSERLCVPHPHMHEREFVLYPLAEIAPELKLPKGEPLSELLAKCPMGTLEPVAL